MAHIPSPLSPQEVAALRAILAARGRHDEPVAFEGLRILGRARDLVPSAVGQDDDSLLFLTPEGGLVIGAVRDDGNVTYVRMDNSNNVRVVGFHDVLVTENLTNILSEITGTTASVDAVTAELTKLSSRTSPVTFLAVNEIVAVQYTQFPIPTASHGRQQLQIDWMCTGATTVQFRSYRKYDNAAWAGAGTIPAAYAADNWWQYTPGGLVFGAPPVGGAGPNILVARLQDPDGVDSVMVEMVATNLGGTVVATGTVRRSGGTQ